jgi:hypothetical protein
MKRFALAILVVTAAAAAVFLTLNWPGAEASPDVTITVNSTDDTNIRDAKLTLREAMMLASEALPLGDLEEGECNQVSGAIWQNSVHCVCVSTDPPGAVSADTIVFDASVVGYINLSSPLPALSTGDDTIDSGEQWVVVNGADTFDCFDITSDGNTINNMSIEHCISGVWIHGGNNNTIGGSSEGDGNYISVSLNGVSITGSGTSGNSVIGNGIYTLNARGIRISGGAQGNIVQDNWLGSSTELDGVSIWGTGTNWNEVKGNYIYENKVRGVGIGDRAQGNVVGGTGPDEANIIWGNTEAGVFVQEDALYNTIRGNDINSNGGKGIELTDGGNTELAPPTIQSAGSVFGTACPNCEVDIYSDDEDEGRVYEGSTTADGDGNWSFSGTPQGPNITATATDSDGNTSEFSAPLTPPWPTPTPTPTPTPSPTPTATPPAVATRTVVWGPGWHNATRTGASTPEEAFACAAGNYAAAYRLVSGGWERYFPDRPDLSNMTDLEQYDAFLILVTGDVTCEMSVADAPGTERTLDWGVGWQNEGWTGPDGTLPQDAFACAAGNYAAAYRLVGGSWERHFPERLEISNMGPLNHYDPFLILVTAPVSCTMPIAP